MAKKKLYIMCGPAGSGKTTWVREHANPGHSAHISRDRIRFSMVAADEYYFSREDEVYTEFVRQICKALSCDWIDEVYVDATHLTKKSRENLIREVDRVYPLFDLVGVVVMPDIETCLAQNAQRTGRECVPESVIRNMYNNFQSPLRDDLRYDFIYVNDVCVYGTETN